MINQSQIMSLEGVVFTWLDHQASIIVINMLHGCPSSHNSVSRAEREIVKILMERMAGGLGACIWRFVDEHSVTSSDIGSNKTLNIVKNL